MSRRNIGQLAANLFMLLMVYQVIRQCGMLGYQLRELSRNGMPLGPFLLQIGYSLVINLLAIWLIWTNPNRSSSWFAPIRLSGSSVIMCAALRFIVLSTLVYYVQAAYAFYGYGAFGNTSGLLVLGSWVVLLVIVFCVTPKICEFIQEQMDSSVMWYTRVLLACKRGIRNYYGRD